MATVCRRLALLERRGCILSGNGPYIEAFSLLDGSKIMSVHLNEGVEVHQLCGIAKGIIIRGQSCVMHVTDERIFDRDESHHPTTLIFEYKPMKLAILDDEKMLVIFSNYSVINYHYVPEPSVPLCVTAVNFGTLLTLDELTTFYIEGSTWQNLMIIAGTSGGAIWIFMPDRDTAAVAKLSGIESEITGLDICGDRFYCTTAFGELAVWETTILDCLRGGETDLEAYNFDVKDQHQARIEAICHDDDDYIYTISNEQVLYAWRLENCKLIWQTERHVPAGRPRTICFCRGRIFITFDSSAFISVKAKEIRSNTDNWVTINNVKSFVRVKDKLYSLSVSQKDQLNKTFRYVTRSPSNVVRPQSVAYVGRRVCRFVLNNEIIWLWCEFNATVISVVLFDKYALVQKVDYTGELLDIERRTLVATFTFKKIAKNLGLKKHFFLTSLAIILLHNQKLFVFAGTSCGKVFYCRTTPGGKNLPIQTILELNKKMTNKAVSQILISEMDVLFLCENGLLVCCNIDKNYTINIASSRPLCPWFPGFSPCGFAANNVYVLGFRGRIFYIVDYMRCEIVRGYDVGGRHRQWSFQMKLVEAGTEPLYNASFAYIKKTELKIVELFMRPSLFHSAMFHCKVISSICLIRTSCDMFFAISAGHDRLVQVFSINLIRGDWLILLALFVPAIPTSVQGVIMESKEIVLLIGARDGVITAYSILPNDMCRGTSSSVRSVEFKCKGFTASVTCLHVMKKATYVDEFHCLASYSDGRLLMLTIKMDKPSPKCTVDKTKHFGTLQCPEKNFFSKVIGWYWEDSQLICGGTSDGNLMVWRKRRNATPKFVSMINIDNCRVTSLTTSTNETWRYVAAGTSSGKISVFSFHGEIIVSLSPFPIYKNPVAGVALEVYSDRLCVNSISRNGHFTSYETEINKSSTARLSATYETVLRFVKDFVIEKGVGFIAVGDGMEILPPTTKMKNYGQPVEQEDE